MAVNMIRCPAGHYYDASQHSSCPYCGVPDLNITLTQPIKKGGLGEEDVTIAAGAPRKGKEAVADKGEGVTIGYYHSKIGVDPVVGWLVCIEGKDRGRDYRLHSERNFIGRAETMDVCVRGDETISRENHAIISFNPRNNTFKVQPGDGRGLVYLNSDDIDVPTALNPYDLIELGQSKFLFIPMCGEKFKWE
jgi:hypothetical protein